MPRQARTLQTNSDEFPALPAAEPPDPLAVDSDVVVILAALLCALICVVVLAAVARCARSRRLASATAGGAANTSVSTPAPNKGIKKKALKALPKLAYEDAVAAVAAARGDAGEDSLTECPICLSEFEEGHEVRILPQCGHGFHVACVDTWLGSHSSCPSCRRLLVVAPPPPPPRAATMSKCQKCTVCSGARSGEGSSTGGSFLP